MITEEALRVSALRSNERFVQAVEFGYDPARQYEPSDLFRKKIRKLYHRANHPYLYKTMRRVASVVLVALLACGVWLSVDATARATFFNWVKEVYEQSVVYRIMPRRTAEILPRYEFGWLPEGFGEPDIYEDGTMYSAVYSNPVTGDGLIFDYCLLNEEAQTEILTQQEPEHLYVNGMAADYYMVTGDSKTNNLLWIDYRASVLCSINSTLCRNDILHIVESIKLVSLTK